MITQPPAELADYEFNIRSFHPEKTFGWSGLYFKGDDRRFSLRPSGVSGFTSRIWHRFVLHAQSGTVSERITASDDSKSAWADRPAAYSGPLQPRGRVVVLADRRPDNVYKLRVSGGYAGENHAMPGSADMQEGLGLTYVPSLDVNYKILVDVDRMNRHIDLVAYVKGDGFPNCEAFVVGPGGQPLFLGVHVRKGAAPLSLVANAGYPMIACALRLPIKRDGRFEGRVGDELDRRRHNKRNIEYQSIQQWNERFLSISPNAGHCMGLENGDLKELFDLECMF